MSHGHQPTDGVHQRGFSKEERWIGQGPRVHRTTPNSRCFSLTTRHCVPGARTGTRPFTRLGPTANWSSSDSRFSDTVDGPATWRCIFGTVVGIHLLVKRRLTAKGSKRTTVSTQRCFPMIPHGSMKRHPVMTSTMPSAKRCPATLHRSRGAAHRVGRPCDRAEDRSFRL